MKNTKDLIKLFKEPYKDVEDMSDLPLSKYVELLYAYIKENENLIPIRIEVDMALGSLYGAIEAGDKDSERYLELTIRNITRDIAKKINELWKQ